LLKLNCETNLTTIHFYGSYNYFVKKAKALNKWTSEGCFFWLIDVGKIIPKPFISEF